MSEPLPPHLQGSFYNAEFTVNKGTRSPTFCVAPIQSIIGLSIQGNVIPIFC